MSKKFKTIYLHFGSDKTGSTSIQDYLHTYRDELYKKFDIVYAPDKWQPFLASYMAESDLNFGFNIETNQTNFKKTKERDNHYISRLKERIEKSKEGSTFVVSFEGFHQLNELQIKKMKEFFLFYTDDVKIIYYLRPPLSYAVSATSQCIRTGRLIQDHPPVQPYKKYINRFLSCFEKKDIILKPFIKSKLTQEDVLIDFLSEIGINTNNDIPKKIAQENESLSDIACNIGNEVIIKITKFITENNISIYTMGHHLNMELLKIKGGKLKLTQNQAQSVLERANVNNKYIYDEFGLSLHEENESFIYNESEMRIINSTIHQSTIKSFSDFITEKLEEKLKKTMV